MSYSSIFKREVELMIDGNGNFLYVIALFILMISISLFTINREIIVKVLPVLLWICSVFIMQISIHNIFENDYSNGILEQVLMQGYIPEIIVFLKIFSYWVCIGIPISIVSMLIDFCILGDDLYTVVSLGIALSMSLLVVSFISSIGHALILGKSGGTTIAQILILPIIIPILIYFNLLFYNLKNKVYDDYTMLLGVIVISLIPVSIFFVFCAIKLAIEQD
ncbi:heme exporter protein CcmB [Neoehrlichia mikurensis]|uniref:Heme exporter protein B n=1 Tax=Neoehrlichia mikurensis TaxID=89586 RepID=A0A9Q9F409_9RICK|nr:heme exporter protein CcmB [Neoehrlichia mikurensis]QXK92292.1 heme exporter protein CcmB [Neoehrlichia mikurensis]QXK92746.1 heme exporter protein CcmB [Neoehrlichia mikurensis]QXK93987.1 heme exporter protein CcmB [Neoehrlichia mikurensis]UTO55850.1 heme exporter protein CcmB [Neoehrlichia mikurensis]UTO56765.1 heme exporter protein CcmB [Neoehrlichia mikurensis]